MSTKYRRQPTKEIDSKIDLDEDYAAYQGEVPPASLIPLLNASEDT